MCREHGLKRIGLELSQGTQAADRMVGEPTVFTQGFFDAFGAAEDASPLLAEARMIKTDQEIERMREANELAAAATEHVAANIASGMRESDVAAMWEGHVLAEGGGRARGYALVWSGPGIRTFTATGDRPVQENEPTLLEIWVCVDGYWCDHTKNVCPGELTAAYDELLDQLLAVYNSAVDHARDGASLPELDRARARRDRRGRLSGPAVPSDLPRRRRARPRASLRAPGGIGHDPGRNGAGDRAGDLLGGGRRLATRGQLPDHRRRAGEALPVSGRLPMTETLRREAARVAVIDMDRRLLLLHTWDPGRSGSDVWELPGGGLRDGEIPVDGARRELYEETGIRAGEFGPRLGVVETDFEFDGRRYRQRETIFSLWVEREDCAPAALEPGVERAAHLGHEWVPIDDLRRRRLRLHPRQLPDLLERYLT